MNFSGQTPDPKGANSPPVNPYQAPLVLDEVSTSKVVDQELLPHRGKMHLILALLAVGMSYGLIVLTVLVCCIPTRNLEPWVYEMLSILSVAGTFVALILGIVGIRNTKRDLRLMHQQQMDRAGHDQTILSLIANWAVVAPFGGLFAAVLALFVFCMVS